MNEIEAKETINLFNAGAVAYEPRHIPVAEYMECKGFLEGLKAARAEAVPLVEELLEAAKGYLFNGHEPTDSDVHQESLCRQCKLEQAITKAEAYRQGKAGEEGKGE